MKISTTFPSIFVTDNEERARQVEMRCDPRTDFDVIVFVTDREADYSQSLRESVHQTTIEGFAETIDAILQAYR